MRFALASLLLAACSIDPVQYSQPSPPGMPDIPDTGFHMPLQSLGAFSYTVKLEAGVEYFDVIVDTGSSTTGVAAATCAGCTKVSPLYTPGPTATEKMLPPNSQCPGSVPVCTQYADGTGWGGNVFTDQSWLRGPFVPLDLVAISSQNGFFDNSGAYEGIMGFGPKQLLEDGTSSYMDKLASMYASTELMAFRLCSFSGDMWLEGYDPMAAAADPQWTPMVPIDASNNPFYAVQIAGVAVGTNALAVTAADFGPVLLDTGTSISYIPDPALIKLLAAINNDPTFKTMFNNKTVSDTPTGGCVTAAGVTSNDVDMMLPALSVSYPDGKGGSFTIDVPASQSYLYPVGMGQFCLAFSSAGPDATGGSLIGDTLLTGMLTIFDVQNLQIGLAPQAGCAPFDPLPASPAPLRQKRFEPLRDHPWFHSSPHFRPRPLRLPN
jgi:hypothetical protein